MEGNLDEVVTHTSTQDNLYLRLDREGGATTDNLNAFCMDALPICPLGETNSRSLGVGEEEQIRS